MAKDFSQDAEVTIENISEDRRCLRFKRQIALREFDFDDTIVLRLFNAEDVIQLTFSDGMEEFFVALKISELPLSLSNKTVWFAQARTK